MRMFSIIMAGLIFFTSQNIQKPIPPPDLSKFITNASCPRILNHQDLIIRLFDYYPTSQSNINSVTRIIKGELKQGKLKIMLWTTFTRGWWWQTNHELFEEKNGKLIPITIEELSKRIHYDIQERHIAYIKNHRLC